MNKPELYNVSNSIQKTVSLRNLKNYSQKIRWNRTADTAIDLGCGDGSFSVLVKNCTPSSYKKFVACDISKEMIHFAQTRFADEDIVFQVMDIVGEFPEDMKGAFNHVFSFYTLHWIKNQEKAFQNIYDLMSDGGHCLLTFVGSSTIYSVYAALAKSPKWKLWLRNYDEIFKGPYHDVENPKKKVEETMAKCGFKDIEVSYKKNANTYKSLRELRDFMHAMEPFKMPDDIIDEFIHDYVTVGLEMDKLQILIEDNMEKSFIIYDYVFNTYANK